MSLFVEHTTTCRYYEYTDVPDDKISSVDFDTDSYEEISIFNIRLTDQDSIIEGDVLGEYRANVDYDGCNRGGVIYFPDSEEAYRIVRQPRYNTLFGKYKLNMKKM